MSPRPKALIVWIAVACLFAFATAVSANCPPGQLYPNFTLQTAGNSPFGVLVADLNRDGIPDIAAVDNGSAEVGTLLGVGNGAFQTVRTFSVGPGAGHVAAADFNGDSILDIAVNSSGGDAISVLRGNGDGTFRVRTLVPAGHAPYGVAAGDFNSDGKMDLVSANFLGNNVSVMRGDGAGGFSLPDSFPAGIHPYFIATADFNGDGILDLAVTNQDGNDISILLGNGSSRHGNGTFGAAVHYNTGFYPYSLAIGDFNADGIADLAVANGGSGDIVVLRGLGAAGAGNGSFAPGLSYGTGGQPRSVITGDFDGDGVLDLAVADYGGLVEVLPGLKTAGVANVTFDLAQVYGAGSGATFLAQGDFNRDGLPDLAVANYGTTAVAVLLHGCGAPPPPPPPPSSHAPTLTRVRDVPNDQGGKVFVTWLHSDLDSTGLSTITGYRVWRRIMPESSSVTIGAPHGAPLSLRPLTLLTLAQKSGNSTTVTFWEALVTLPPEALQGYGYTAPTTQDSMASGNPYTAFFVTALTQNPAVFYPSNIDSGFSVDNLPPAAPGGANATFTPTATSLRWNSNHEADLAGYRIYRTPHSGGGNTVLLLPLAFTSDTAYFDASGGTSYSYGVAAVDLHGGESARIVLTPSLVTEALATIALTEVDPSCVHLEWSGSAVAGRQGAVFRSEGNDAWSPVGTATAAANGRLTFDDRSIVAGRRYGYRLDLAGGGLVTSEVWVNVPLGALALAGARPNPSRSGALSVAFSLASDAPASLELIDMAGRRVLRRSLTELGPGPHVVAIERESPLPVGVYAIRLSQSGRTLSTKAAVVMR